MLWSEHRPFYLWVEKEIGVAWGSGLRRCAVNDRGLLGE